MHYKMYRRLFLSKDVNAGKYFYYYYNILYVYVLALICLLLSMWPMKVLLFSQTRERIHYTVLQHKTINKILLYHMASEDLQYNTQVISLLCNILWRKH